MDCRFHHILLEYQQRTDPMKNLTLFTSACILSLLMVTSCCDDIPFCNPQPPSDNCACPLIYLPVCGCDGVTYSNACVARCHNVFLFTQGPCECEAHIPDPDCACPFIYLPVCGCDDVTYGNDCEAECHGITDYTQGECP